jgi:hypothetical protein
MKQTAVEKLGIAFRQWQTDWDNFDKTGKNKPVSYDEFLAPFLEIEKEQIMDAFNSGENSDDYFFPSLKLKECEVYYNETYKSK